MKIKPCGYFVLVELNEVVDVEMSEMNDTRYERRGDDLVDRVTGIVLPGQGAELDKHQMAEETGIIKAFGPACYVGWRGCEREDIPAHEQWGVKVGDKIEFRRFEGKSSFVEGYENFRYIPDTHILGVINDG